MTARFWYIRRRLRLTTARSFADTPAIAVRSAAIAFGITRARIAAPLAVRRTTTSRLLVADRVRVTSPIFTSRLTTRDKVETSMLVLAARSIWRWPLIVREHRQHAPHRDAQAVTGKRVLPEIDHQGQTDAIDQVGKIFAEVEARAIGHERGNSCKCRWQRFYGPAPMMSKRRAGSAMRFGP